MESKNSWLKIENIKILPNCKENNLNKNIELYKRKWILATGMKINVSDLNVAPEKGFKFYKKTNLTSKLSFQSGKFLVPELIEIK